MDYHPVEPFYKIIAFEVSGIQNDTPTALQALLIIACDGTQLSLLDRELFEASKEGDETPSQIHTLIHWLTQLECYMK